MERIKKELELLKEKSQMRHIPDVNGKTDGKIVIDGKEYINFASNDYLGISTKTELREEFLRSSKSLMSSASARLLTGSSEEYRALEKVLADIFSRESALIFNTGYQMNLGVISALIGRGDVVFSDRLNHASIIDGMRLSEGNFFRYKHLDYDNLEKLLREKRSGYKRALIVSESVFSMDGDVADIDKLVELKNKYDCMLMIDEAHAFCAYGETLSGVCGKKDCDIITATLGKAVGSFGGFCVSGNDIISYLINKSRPFIFSTSIPPINIAWSYWLLTKKRDYIINQKQKLSDITKEAHRIFSDNTSKTHIIPVITGDNENTVRISEQLLAQGFYIPAIRPPTVPEGSSRLRISLTADCRQEDIQRLHTILNF